MPKGIKQSPLEKVLLKSAEKYIRFSLKDCVTVEVPQTLEYRGGQLNAAPVLEVENFTNWKKRLMCISLDFQDSPDDEEDTRNSHEYLNDLEEGYQAKALLAKSKRYFKEGKNKGLIAETCDWDDEEVSSDENEVTKVKALMALTDEERVLVGKESARNGDWTKISMKKVHTLLEMEDNDDRKSFLDYMYMSITSSNIPKSSETEDSTLPDQDTDKVPSNESQRNTTDPSVVVVDSSATNYDSTDESLVCSTPLLSLKKLDGAKPISRPKTIKSILKSKSTFKAETLKGITINKPSSAPARGKSSSSSKTNSAPADHNGIEWFRKRETLQAKNVESYKASKNDSSSALRSKTLTKRKPFTRSPNMYKECLAEFWYSAKTLKNSKVFFLIPTGGIFGKVGVNTFRNAIGAHYLPHSSEYVSSPSIDVVRQCFLTIGYGEEVLAKGTLKKSLLPPRWRLLMAQIIQCLGGKTGGFDQITNKDAIILYSLANGINIDYANIFWEDIIIKLKKKQREKVVPYTRFLSLHKPGAQTRHKKPLNSSKQPSVSSKEATKGGSSKALTGSKTGHSKKRKESSSAMDSNPSQPPVSTPVDTRMHKEEQQATGGPTSLGVTSKARANPQLSSAMSTFNLNEPIYLASFIIHSESASGNDASAASTTEANPGNSSPSDFLPQQHGMNEETKNTSYDHLFAGKGDSSIASQIKEETSSTIKLEDLAKLVSHVQPSFKDPDSPKDDLDIVVTDSDEDGDDEVHATENVKSEDTLVPKSSSPSSTIFSQYITTQIATGKVLKTEFSNILSAHDFSSSLLTKLKDLPSKFNDLTEESYTQVVELKTLQWELPAEFLVVLSQVEMVQAKLKTLDALPSLLNKVTNALN
ncbi:hypothetical protein Tco_0598195 [Tanacetum coccineum]